MVFLLFIHSYNVTDFPLYATSTIDEPLTITNFIEYFIANGLLRFRIPLLMLISGYLLAYKDYTTYACLLKKKLRTLIVPYILLSSITLLCIAIVEWLFMTDNIMGLWGKKITTYTIHDFAYRIFISPIPFQLWFLRILFIFIICYPVIKYCLQKVPVALLLVLFILSVAFNSLHYTLVFYFAVGIYLQLQKIDINTKPIFLNIKGYIIFTLAIVTLKTLIAFYGILYFGKYTSYILQALHVTHAISSILVAWFGIDKLINYCMRQRWFLAIVGSYFFIFALHEPLMVMLLKPSLILFGGGEFAKLFVFFTLPIAILVLCILLDALVSKASPRFYSLLTGGRGSIRK